MAEPSNIIDLMEKTAFSALFKDGSWSNWKVYLKSLFALEMTDSELEVYQKYTGRTTAPTQPFTESALVIGRRGGKSRMMAWVCCYLALFRDYRPHLAPGERATIAIIASDRRQSRSIFRYIVGTFELSPALKNMVTEQTNESLTLKNRVQIEIATASFRVTRGYTFAAVLCDETAFWRDETSANPDTEIFRALRPGLSTIPGAMLINASSPYRRAGVLWSTYQRHFSKDGARVLVWQAPTVAMNPQVDPEIIAEAYDEDPESAASEYGAEFRTDIADFVPRSAVDACIDRGVFERPPARSVVRKYYAFLDAAGGSGTDSMVIAIAHTVDGMPVLDAIRERKPPFSPEDVTRDFAVLAKAYGITRAESDRWGGDWVGEAFRKHNITVTPTAKPKSDIYRDMLPSIMSGNVLLLDNPRLIAQLCALERRTARGGRDSIDHAPGGHDDVCNAAAGALLLANTVRGPMRINPELLLRV